MRKKIALVVAPVIIFALCAASYWFYKQHYRESAGILGYGTIEAKETHVGSRIGGRVEVVYVCESDIVEQNAVLISLESGELEAQKREAQAASRAAQAMEKQLQIGYRRELITKAAAVVEEQRQYLSKVKKGPREQEKQTQKQVMEAAQAEYKLAKREYARIEAQRNVSEQQKDKARRQKEVSKARWQAENKRYELLLAGSRSEDIAIAIQRLAQAQAEYERLKAGPRPEELDHARAQKEQIQAQIEGIETRLKECRICAPIDGRVEVCDLVKGDMLVPGQTAVTLLKPKDLWVKIYIKEYELDRVKIGQQVEVVAETSRRKKERSIFMSMLHALVAPPLETKVFQGKIVHIASRAEFTPRNVQTKDERGNQVFAVKVEIIDPEPILRPGISVLVREISGE